MLCSSKLPRREDSSMKLLYASRLTPRQGAISWPWNRTESPHDSLEWLDHNRIHLGTDLEANHWPLCSHTC